MDETREERLERLRQAFNHIEMLPGAIARYTVDDLRWLLEQAGAAVRPLKEPHVMTVSEVVRLLARYGDQEAEFQIEAPWGETGAVLFCVGVGKVVLRADYQLFASLRDRVGQK